MGSIDRDEASDDLRALMVVFAPLVTPVIRQGDTIRIKTPSLDDNQQRILGYGVRAARSTRGKAASRA